MRPELLRKYPTNRLLQFRVIGNRHTDAHGDVVFAWIVIGRSRQIGALHMGTMLEQMAKLGLEFPFGWSILFTEKTDGTEPTASQADEKVSS